MLCALVALAGAPLVAGDLQERVLPWALPHPPAGAAARAQHPSLPCL